MSEEEKPFENLCRKVVLSVNMSRIHFELATEYSELLTNQLELMAMSKDHARDAVKLSNKLLDFLQKAEFEQYQKRKNNQEKPEKP